MVKAMNVAFGIGIAIILFLVVILGIQTFYPEPEYDDYFDEKIYEMNNEVDCLSLGGEWNEGAVCPEGQVCVPTPGRCSIPQETRDDFDDARDGWSRNVFFIANTLGILTVIISMFLLGMINISTGVAFSGIVLILYGFGVGWESTEDVWKFLMGIVVAALFITFAVILNKKFSKE